MPRLVEKVMDAGSILNAQWSFLGKGPVPLSVRVHGRLHISGEGERKGELILGRGVTFIGTVVPIELGLYDKGHIEIGEHTFINYGSSITARSSVKIGAHCHLGHYTFIMDNDQHDVVRHSELPPSAPVTIEDNVWIGSKSVILPGVRIGRGAVIGAGSIVTSDVPPDCVTAGNPARVLRYLTADT